MLNIFAFAHVFKLEFEDYKQAVFGGVSARFGFYSNFWDGNVTFMQYNLLKFQRIKDA